MYTKAIHRFFYTFFVVSHIRFCLYDYNSVVVPKNTYIKNNIQAKGQCIMRTCVLLT